MHKTLFEVPIVYVSNTKKIFIFAFLVVVLLINVIVINNSYSDISYAKSDETLSYYDSPFIKIYKEDNTVKTTKSNRYTEELLDTYECANTSCRVYDLKKDAVLIYDNGEYIIYNYSDQTSNKLSLEGKEYEDVKYFANDLIIKDNGKYALYNINENKFISEFIYDGKYKEEGLYKNTSKYNQVLDMYKENKIDYTYKHCNNLDGEELYCSEHMEGTITNEEVDNELDKVLSQYPNLEDRRLFLIKSAIETVGLPYLWGGGHLSLENTMDIANTAWGLEMVYLSNGFRNQTAGSYYPSGLDCAGFVRWAYYIASGVDLYKDKINVISGNNPDVTLIERDELLPGDIILDKDHVVLYLYKDDEGKDISVHASYDNLKVEISNYKKGNTYYRLNKWME